VEKPCRDFAYRFFERFRMAEPLYVSAKEVCELHTFPGFSRKIGKSFPEKIWIIFLKKFQNYFY
jgi:hypothetical protein